MYHKRRYNYTSIMIVRYQEPVKYHVDLLPSLVVAENFRRAMVLGLVTYYIALALILPHSIPISGSLGIRLL